MDRYGDDVGNTLQQESPMLRAVSSVEDTTKSVVELVDKLSSRLGLVL